MKNMNGKRREGIGEGWVGHDVIAPSQKMLEEGDYNGTYRWHDDVLMIRGFS
jgi:hypothetical protein